MRQKVFDDNMEEEIDIFDLEVCTEMNTLIIIINIAMVIIIIIIMIIMILLLLLLLLS